MIFGCFFATPQVDSAAMVLRTSAVFVLGALAGAGCGSGSPSAPSTPTPSATPALTRTVLATRSFTLASAAAFTDTVDNVPSGVVDARADWPGSSDLNLYVTDTSC